MKKARPILYCKVYTFSKDDVDGLSEELEKKYGDEYNVLVISVIDDIKDISFEVLNPIDMTEEQVKELIKEAEGIV